MLSCCLHLLGWHFRMLSNYLCGRRYFFNLVELDIDFYFSPPVVIAGICHESEEQGFFPQ